MPSEVELPSVRNLKYIVEKEKYSNNMPLSFYDEFPQEIKQALNDPVL